MPSSCRGRAGLARSEETLHVGRSRIPLGPFPLNIRLRGWHELAHQLYRTDEHSLAQRGRIDDARQPPRDETGERRSLHEEMLAAEVHTSNPLGELERPALRHDRLGTVAQSVMRPGGKGLHCLLSVFGRIDREEVAAIAQSLGPESRLRGHPLS